MFQEHLSDASGIQINFAETSSPGQPLVLLHDGAAEWQSFLPLIPVFACNFRVYAIDLRGHGKSSWVPNKYHLSDYAKDIQCFIDQQVGQPTIIYGHSLGAQIALTMASQAPACVRALILGDIPFYYHNLTIKETMWYEPFVELHHVTSSFHSAQEIDDYMAKNYPNMDQQRRIARAETLSHVDPDVVTAILQDRHIEGYDTDAMLRKIVCPVLLIQGNPELGAALREEDLVYMIERIRHCNVVHMQDVGHGLPSGEVLSSMVSYLESL